LTVAVIVAAVVLISTAMIYLDYRFIIIPRREIQRYDEYTAEAKILGHTPDQIIATYGKPDGDTIDDPKTWPEPGRHRVMVFYGPYGETCRIELVDGVATEVEHYLK